MTPTADEVAQCVIDIMLRWPDPPSMEEEWAAAITSEGRAELLMTWYPSSNRCIKYNLTLDLMQVELPATKSSNPAAELTFCDATIRGGVCGLAYCVEDLDLECDGKWYCEECREYIGYGEEYGEEEIDEEGCLLGGCA